jgi:hypothetical protein
MRATLENTVSTVSAVSSIEDNRSGSSHTLRGPPATTRFNRARLRCEPQSRSWARRTRLHATCKPAMCLLS